MTVSSSAIAPSLLVDSLILNASYLRPDLFSRLSALTFNLFTSAPFKLAYARQFARCFATLLAVWVKFSGALEHSSLDYAVQLFTIPSIALQLVRDERLFAQMMQLALRYLECHTTHSRTPPYINSRSLASRDNPFALLLSNCTYLLRVATVPQLLWSEQPAETLRSWFACLQLQEGMDPHTQKRHGQMAA